MVRKSFLLMAFLILLAATSLAQQPLGDVARSARHDKRPSGAKVSTNDDTPPANAASMPPPTEGDKPAAADDKAAPAASADDAKKLEGEWRTRIAGQKKE